MDDVRERSSGLLDCLLDSPGGILIVLLIGLILRLPRIGQSLWYDEVLYSTHYGRTEWRAVIGGGSPPYGSGTTWSDLWQFLIVNPTAPVYRLLMVFWHRFSGESEIFLRIPALLFGLASIWLTWAVARRFGGRRTAFLAALFLSFSPVHVWYSRDATPYTMTLCLLLAAVLASTQLRAGGFSWSWLTASAVLFFGAAFAHYFATAFVVPLTVSSLFQGRLDRSGRVRTVTVNVAVALSVLLVYGVKFLSGHMQTDVGFRRFSLFEWWMLFFNWFLHGNCLWVVHPYRVAPPYVIGDASLLLLQIMFFGLFLTGLFFRDRTDRLSYVFELALYVCALPLILLILNAAGFFHRAYTERYLFTIMPFFVIALVRGATRLGTRTARNLAVGALIAVAVTSYAMLFLRDDSWTVYKHNPDWRSAVGYLAGNGDIGESVVLVVSYSPDLEYYVLKTGGNPASVRQYDAQELDRLLSSGRTRRVYAVKNVYTAGASELDGIENFDQFRTMLSENRRLHFGSVRSFKGVDVWTFDVVPSETRTAASFARGL